MKASIALKNAEYALTMARVELLNEIHFARHASEFGAARADAAQCPLRMLDESLMQPSRGRVLSESSTLYRVWAKRTAARLTKKAA